VLHTCLERLRLNLRRDPTRSKLIARGRPSFPSARIRATPAAVRSRTARARWVSEWVPSLGEARTSPYHELMNSETVVFDESGTAGDNPFIFAGFAFRGDIGLLRDEWRAEQKSAGLKRSKKGTRYSTEQLLLAAEFLVRQDVLPITTHSRPTPDDFESLKEKIRKLKLIRAGERRKAEYTATTYLWCQHAGVSIPPSLICLPIHRGRVERIEVAVDEYLQQPGPRRMVERVFRKWLRGDVWQEHARAYLAKVPGHPQAEALLQNSQFDPSGVSLDWNAKGALGNLADVMASIYRRHLEAEAGGAGGGPAWGRLVEHAQVTYGSVPACMGRDITEHIRPVMSRPWPAPRRGA